MKVKVVFFRIFCCQYVFDLQIKFEAHSFISLREDSGTIKTTEKKYSENLSEFKQPDTEVSGLINTSEL